MRNKTEVKQEPTAEKTPMPYVEMHEVPEHGRTRVVLCVGETRLVLEDAKVRDIKNLKWILVAMNAHADLLGSVKLHTRFWNEMPKGQLGRISCDIGILNDAFILSRIALNKAEAVS